MARKARRHQAARDGSATATASDMHAAPIGLVDEARRLLRSNQTLHRQTESTITDQIDRFESQFGITSEQMLAGLADGSITATPDIIEWRHWINFRDGLAAANRVSRP